MKRVSSLVLAAALLVALPACGKTNEATRAAGLTPSTAVAYFSVSLDPSLAQKRDLMGIVKKFPKAKATFDQEKDDILSRAVKDVGCDYTKDIKPWLGSELALAALPGSSNVTPVLLAKVKSGQKSAATAALAKCKGKDSSHELNRVVGDFAVVASGDTTADSTNALDAVQRQSGNSDSSLAKQQKFTKVVDRLHGDRLFMAWVDGRSALQLAKSRAKTFSRFDFSSLNIDTQAAFDGHVETNAAVIDGVADPGLNLFGAGDPKITDALPADSLGELTVFDLAGLIDRVATASGQAGAIDKAGAALQQQYGINLRDDILSWMHGETVVVVGPAAGGGSIPNVAVVVQPSDDAKARAAVDKINAALSAKGIHLQPRPVNGGTMYTLPQALRQGVQPAIGLIGGRFIVAGTPEYLSTIAKTATNKLVDSPEYKATLSSSSSNTQSQLLIRFAGVRDLTDALLKGAARATYDKNAAPVLSQLDAAAMRVVKDGSRETFELRVTFKK